MYKTISPLIIIILILLFSFRVDNDKENIIKPKTGESLNNKISDIEITKGIQKSSFYKSKNCHYSMEDIYKNYSIFLNYLNDTDSKSLAFFLDKNISHSSENELYISDFRNAIVHSDFNKMKKLITELSGTEIGQRAVSAALDVALTRRNVEFLRYLLNIGGIFSRENLGSLINLQDPDFVTLLENEGIDPYQTQASGDNSISPISYLIYTNTIIDRDRSDGYKKIFNKFLDYGYDVNENNFGINPLLISLIIYRKKNDDTSIFYIKNLIKNGAKINLNHKIIIHKIKNESLHLYNNLIEKVPKLANIQLDDNCFNKVKK